MNYITRLTLIIAFTLPGITLSVPLISKEEWGCENAHLEDHCIGWRGGAGTCIMHPVTRKKHCQMPTGVLP